jgi:LacI family transcriptional regulator
MGKRVDGLVVSARRADKRLPIGPFAHGLPVVYVFTQADDPDALCLLPDDEGGAVLAVKHLTSGGRTRIAHVTGPEHFEAVRLRRNGYQAALAAAGLASPDGFYLSGSWSEAWGRDAAARLFDGRAVVPDAVFCGNDQIARGVVDALRERGRRVPDDVAVIGFDNWEIVAAATRPSLTTVDMNLKDLGREAGLTLLKLVDREAIEPGIRKLPCRLVVRDSCGAPPGG